MSLESASEHAKDHRAQRSLGEEIIAGATELPFGMILLDRENLGRILWRNNRAAEIIRKDPETMSAALAGIGALTGFQEQELLLDPEGLALPVRISASRLAGASGLWLWIEDLSAERKMKKDTIGQLLGGIAHEINNPLGAIRLHRDIAATVIEEHPRDAAHSDWSDAEESLQSIAECVDRIEGTIMGLRGLANVNRRSEAGAFDLRQVAQRVVDQLGPKARKLKVSVALEASAALPHVVGDREQLQQALETLLMNAIDAAATREERHVWIRLQLQDRLVECSVTDSGPGIPDANRSRLFDPFFTTKRAGRGIGLSLSVASALVRVNRGTLSFRQSESGRTCFVFRVPTTHAGE